MTDVATLLAQKAELERQIAAAKPQAVAAVLETMKALGVTWDDLGVAPKGPLPPPVVRRKVKYRDAAGHTWTGVGQRPRWLTQAVLSGADVESFRVQG